MLQLWFYNPERRCGNLSKDFVALESAFIRLLVLILSSNTMDTIETRLQSKLFRRSGITVLQREDQLEQITEHLGR